MLFLTSAVAGFLCGILLSLPKIGRLIVILAFIGGLWGSMIDPSFWEPQIHYLWYEWLVYIGGLMTGYYSGKKTLQEIGEEWGFVV